MDTHMRSRLHCLWNVHLKESGWIDFHSFLLLCRVGGPLEGAKELFQFLKDFKGKKLGGGQDMRGEQVQGWCMWPSNL